VVHFTANPNGEAEKVVVRLRALQRLRKLKMELDFSEVDIKSRGAKGKLVTKHPVKKIDLAEEGESTLGARKIWLDETVNRLNADGRGRLLGSFRGQDRILEITQSGYYRLLPYDLSTHFEEDMVHVQKYDPQQTVSVIYYDGAKKKHYVKRFVPETEGKKEPFISEHAQSKLEWISTAARPMVELSFRKENGKQRENETIDVAEFIAVKGEKAQGNILSRYAVKNIATLEPLKTETEQAPPDADTQDPPPEEGSDQISLEF